MDDDLALLSAWRDGDAAAGNELFSRHFRSVVRFVTNKLHDRAEVEDIVQRIFLACVESRDRFEGRSSFRTYLFAVAHNIVVEHFRRRAPANTVFDSTNTAVCDVDPSPSMVAAEREEQRLVIAALRQIPLSYQVVLELFFWERLTGSEIADALEMPEGTVRFRVRKGKELLAKKVRQLSLTAAHADLSDGDLEAWAESLRDAVTAAGRA
ncbi:MAG: sigma-70 family RNA polymerase sigma factor [Myxococcota bacterium]